MQDNFTAFIACVVCHFEAEVIYYVGKKWATGLLLLCIFSSNVLFSFLEHTQTVHYAQNKLRDILIFNFKKLNEMETMLMLLLNFENAVFLFSICR